MRKVTWGIVVAALTVLTVPTAAWSCPVLGRVICERANDTDPVVPLEKVQLTFTDGVQVYPNQFAPLPGLTDASGGFSFHIDGDGICPGYWGVTMDLSRLGGASSIPYSPVYIGYEYTGYVLPDLEVKGTDLPMCAPTQSACDLTGVPEGVLACDVRPWGNPRAECAKFGNYVPVGDGYSVSGSNIIATVAADFAIVKSGKACYAVTKDVSIGDALAYSNAFGVSHVTYCACPPQ